MARHIHLESASRDRYLVGIITPIIQPHMRIHMPYRVTMLCLILSLGLLAAGCISMDESTEVVLPDKEDGLLIHIKSGPENPHAVLMGLSLARAMAEDVNVLVFFSVKGIHVALKETPAFEYHGFKNSHEWIADLVERRVALRACPMCLTAEGKNAGDLRDGITQMRREDLFGFTDGRIVTLDF